jgi:hypothetical protein
MYPAEANPLSNIRKRFHIHSQPQTHETDLIEI